MGYERMINEDHEPDGEEITAFVGDADLWLNLKQYLEQRYDFLPDHW